MRAKGLFVADIYQGLFKFGVFNGVQSTCFDTASRFNVQTVSSLTTFHKDYQWERESGIILSIIIFSFSDFFFAGHQW